MTSLAGIKIIEVAAIGPAPFGVMLLADLGADVIRVDRLGGGASAAMSGFPGISRNRRSIAVDLKSPHGRDVVLDLARRSDVFVEGFRPGVAERLGIGPQDTMADNPQLVYARMTGWGQDGPFADRAGHDINYVGLSGSLHPIGHRDRPPPPPLNLVGDFGGGGVYLALGVLAALMAREQSGGGQIVDAAMVDGIASLSTTIHDMVHQGAWSTERQSNLLDGGAHFYNTYETADGRYMAVGAIEPQFYAMMLDRLDLSPDEWPQYDTARWPELTEKLAEVFRSRTRADWEQVFEGVDACVTPVMDLAEAPQHPHLRARDTFVEENGARQPAPAPRLSRTPGAITRPPPTPGEHTEEILADIGCSPADIDKLREAGAVG